jgi:hypothetical protein
MSVIACVFRAAKLTSIGLKKYFTGDFVSEFEINYFDFNIT